MAVYLLSNRKIVRHQVEESDASPDDEYTVPTSGTARSHFEINSKLIIALKRKKAYCIRSTVKRLLLSEFKKHHPKIKVPIKETGLNASVSTQRASVNAAELIVLPDLLSGYLTVKTSFFFNIINTHQLITKIFSQLFPKNMLKYNHEISHMLNLKTGYLLAQPLQIHHREKY